MKQRRGGRCWSCSAVTPASARRGWSASSNSGCCADDALVLRGEAVEQGETELPYAPLLSALRPLVRERHATFESLSAGSRRQLATLLPGLDDGGGIAADARDGSEQLRLFEALLELLDCLSENQPVALILEDMHWADRSTRTFVSFLARSMRQERVMQLLTFRTDELHRRHPMRALLSELERLERARRIDLAPFDRDELAEALTDILGDAPSGGLVERLFARSEGNPLYTEELLAAGLDGRGAAPQSLRDAFMLRIERLPDDAQQAARAIAVGRRLDEDDDRRGHRDRSSAPARGAARGGRRAGAGGRRGRPAVLPPCAAARGAVRRPAARRARRAAPRARAGVRAAQRSDHGDREIEARRRSPATTRRPAISRRRCARRCAPRSPPATCSPTARPPTSPSGRSSCGRASTEPRGSSGSIASSCCRWRRRPTPTAAITPAARCCSSRRSASSTREPTRGGIRRCSVASRGSSGQLNRGATGSPDRGARAGAAAGGRGQRRARVAARVARAHALPARSLPRCDQGRRGGARGGT